MNILISDDDEIQLELLQSFLSQQGYHVFAASNGEQALTLFHQEPIDLVLMDHRMPGRTGDAILHDMKAINPQVRAIMITAYGAVDMAVRVMKLGVDDFLEKPIDLQQLLDKIDSIEQSLAINEDVEEVRESLSEHPLPLDIVGDSAAMQKVLSLARRVADSPWSVLIRGETGTGKELIARLIHLLSPRAEAPFIEVNCAAIPESLFESELFGHEKGAFTGADRQRKGHFEQARGGTLFLDEVGELAPPLQSKLLRALQEKSINRVGAEKAIDIDTRVITATNRDLKALVDQGSFREDLFYRLNVLDIELPPLRQRREDIPALVEHFLQRYAPRPIHIAPETINLLTKYPYPGNVRELQHLIQRSLTLTRSNRLKPADLPDELRSPQGSNNGPLQERLATVERKMLFNALEDTQWVQTKAADLLGISERVLRYKINKYKLKRNDT